MRLKLMADLEPARMHDPMPMPAMHSLVHAKMTGTFV